MGDVIRGVGSMLDRGTDGGWGYGLTAGVLMAGWLVAQVLRR